MRRIGFSSLVPMDGLSKSILKDAVRQVFGEEPVSFYQGTDLGFGTEARVRTLSPVQIQNYPNAQGYLVEALQRLTPVDYSLDPNDSSMLYFDLESHGVEHRWNMDRYEFTRLFQYAWGQTGEIVLTTDLDDVIEQVRKAKVVVVHNGHSFDMSVVFGVDSTEALEMAMNNRILDTMIHANMVFPAPYSYTNRKGHTYRDAAKPENAMVWLGLDNLCYQIGLDGKEGDLKLLAKEFGGFGNIPVTDERYRDYARQDIVSLRQLTRALLTARPMTPYDWREQLNAAIDAQNSRNGFKVDIPVAATRVATLTERKEALLSDLVHRYGLPTTGTMPWRSKVGKNAILKALADQGITPETRPEWPILKTGPSLGGQVMLNITQGTAAQQMGESLAELMGQRSLAQLALDSTQDDGRVHPEITSLQRSGRKSTTKPGLTVWTSRGDGKTEKSYFIADSDDHMLVGFDFSNADQRVVAALSGDKEYAKRFEPGADGHEINGRIMFGDETYDSNPAYYRNEAKAPGHASVYGAQENKLSATTGLPVDLMKKFLDGLAEMYQGVTKWQWRVRDEGSTGWLVNEWGRHMVVEPHRSFTQSPALLGQSGTREIMVDALIRMLQYDIRIITWLRAQVHDELIFSIPRSDIKWAVPKIKELMGTTWHPKGGQGIEFSVSHGGPARTWEGLDH